MTELIVFSVGAAHGFLDLIASKLRADENISLKVEYGPVGETADKVRSQSDCDIAILSDAVIDRLAADGLVSATEHAAIGSVTAAIAARERDPVPTFNDEASLRGALLAAPAIIVPNMRSSTAGKHFHGIIERLGIVDALAASLVECVSGTVAMAQLAASSVVGAIGFTQSTEILSTRGLQLGPSLPETFRLETHYAAVLTSCSMRPAALRFLHFLNNCDLSIERERAGFRRR